MYSFLMDLFEKFHGFFWVFSVFAMIGLLAILYLIASAWYRLISWKAKRKANQGEAEKSEIDQRQDEAIEAISKETKKALALQKELDDMRERLGMSREE